VTKKLVEKTLYSLSVETPGPPERRSTERFVSLLRVGALTIDGRRELCLIRNVSAGGMLIRPYSPLAVGTAVGWTVVGRHGRTNYAFAPTPVPGGFAVMMTRRFNGSD